MKVMPDTNVIISAILFPDSIPAKVLEDIVYNHTPVLCSHIIEELHNIFERKFRDKVYVLENFLLKFPYELIYTPILIDPTKYPYISDIEDLPILVSAILGDVDIIVTGDKEFTKVEIEKPEILTPREFLERYSSKS
ncbi:putative toxin-antitoxin system toxin component, PIN family [bacterium]|nr:putative toxin-antitoxin system toxin component, PIN family [bacterium]